MLFGGQLARNTIWNLLGQGLPVLVAFFAIPRLVHGLGTDRFGVLALVWIVVGYFGLFDLGLGRALTKLVAEKLGAGQEKDVPALAWTSLLLMLILGLLGAAILGLIAPWVVKTALRIPKELEPESLRAFYLLAISLPIITSSSGLVGILSAQQRFGWVNAIGVPSAIFTYAGPLPVFRFSHSLFPVVAVLVAGRLVAWVANFYACFRVMPALKRVIVVERAVVGPLVRFGSWMTISNIVSPLMVNLDRFIIGGMISVSAVAYYATPYTVVTKLWIVPGALMGVLFPAFSASLARDRNRTALLFGRGLRYTFLALYPIVLLTVTWARVGLGLWLGPKFALESTRVLQWLAIGVLVNSMAQVAFTLVQGAGRPDVTAKLHLIELPLYLLGVWWLTRTHGIEGTAMAWMGRVVLDTVFLLAFTPHLLPPTRPAVRQMALTLCAALGALAVAVLAGSVTAKALVFLLVLVSFVLAAWFLILTPEERTRMQDGIRMARVPD